MKFLIFNIIFLLSSSAFSSSFSRDQFEEIMEDLNKSIELQLQSKKPKIRELRKVALKIDRFIFNSDLHLTINKYINGKNTIGFRKLKSLIWKNANKMSWKKKMTWIQKSFHLKRRSFRKELGIYFIFKSLKKEKLFCFKQAIDNQSSLSDMYKLVFDKINSRSLRNLILFHFLFQSRISLNETGNPTYYYSLFSDVDDTALNSFKDMRLPHRGKKLYPGFLEAVNAILEINPQTPLMKKRGCAPGVTFLTGRTRSGGKSLFKKMRNLGIKKPLSALYGSLPASVAVIVSDRPMMKKKVERGIDYSKLYPEKRFIFFGDNGQLDFEVGQNLAKNIGRKKFLTTYINNIKIKSHSPNQKVALLEAGFLRGNKTIKIMDSYSQVIFDLLRLGVLRDKSKVRNYLKNTIESINKFSTKKKYLKKDGMREFFLESIRTNCKFVSSEMKGLCKGLSI